MTGHRANDLHPLDMAVILIRSQFEVGARVMVDRHTDPACWPEYGETPSIDAIGRRIVANLLNQGWVAPTENRPFSWKG